MTARPRTVLILAAALAVPLAVGDAGARAPESSPAPDFGMTPPAAQIQRCLAKHAPARIAPDLSTFGKRTLAMTRKLVEAADAIDRIYWNQVWERGLETLAGIEGRGDPEARDLATLMRINYGPWNRLDEDRPFLGRMDKPEGAAFYPADLSRVEFKRWLDEHPSDRSAFLSPYTVIRRTPQGLSALPYSQAYRDDVRAAAKALREAARLADCKPLQRFLDARAKALETDDYFQSEMLWMDVGNCPVDIAIGPYEFYEDRLLGYKAAFSAVVTVRNPEETKKAARLERYARDLMTALPLPDELRSRVELVKTTPIVVADEVYAAGQSRAGFQIRAYVLPNDERVKVAKGTKHVILKNVVDAKFEQVIRPMARELICGDQVEAVTGDAYYSLMLLWQFSHGLSPVAVDLPGGGKVPARILLRQRNDVIAAARAEAIALMNNEWLVENGALPPEMRLAGPVTHLVSLFETFRRGTHDAHGLAKLIVYNFLAEEGVYRYEANPKRFRVRLDRLNEAVRRLIAELLIIEVEGNYDRAGTLIVDYGVVPGEVREKVAELSGLPFDILPTYAVGE
jgi:hypothetical protein